jgi:hypothetical protein
MLDDLIERSRRTLCLETPPSRHALSLQRWIKGNGCIAREESEFLSHSSDLLSLSSPEDDAVLWMERLVSGALVLFRWVSLRLLKMSAVMYADS